MIEQEYIMTVREKNFVTDAIKDALLEIEDQQYNANEYDATISQGVVDKLVSSLEILGVIYGR